MYSLELGVFMYKFYTNELPLAFKEYFHILAGMQEFSKGIPLYTSLCLYLTSL